MPSPTIPKPVVSEQPPLRREFDNRNTKHHIFHRKGPMVIESGPDEKRDGKAVLWYNKRK